MNAPVVAENAVAVFASSDETTALVPSGLSWRSVGKLTAANVRTTVLVAVSMTDAVPA